MQNQLGQGSETQSDSTQEQRPADSSTQIQPKEIRQKKVEAVKRHLKGSKARVLLSSVFGPYAQDDAEGAKNAEFTEKRLGKLGVFGFGLLEH
jgi:hypothetical protein